VSRTLPGSSLHLPANINASMGSGAVTVASAEARLFARMAHRRPGSCRSCTGPCAGLCYCCVRVFVCLCVHVQACILCVLVPPPLARCLTLSLSLALSLSLSWKTGASCGWAPHRDVRVNGATHARGEILPRRHSTQTFSCISRTVDGQPGTRAHKIPCLMKKSSTVRLPNAKRSPGRPTRGSSH
jgi:hypothetical protein